MSQNYTYTSSPAKKNDTLSRVRPQGGLSDKQQKYLSLGLITGGVASLFYALTRPSKITLFDKYIKDKIFGMDIIVNRYRNYVLELVNNSFKPTLEHIANYKKVHFFKPSDSIVQIKMLDDPKKLADAQDLAFDAILNAKRKLYKQGASDIDEFSTKFYNIKRRVKNDIDTYKNRTGMELNDSIQIPKVKEQIEPDLVEEGENRLINAQQFLMKYMTELQESRLDIVTKYQYSRMADAIVQSRLSQTATKETILNATFKKVKKKLALGQDFIPQYNRASYDLTSIENLSGILKPQKIPERIMRKFELNPYLNTVAEKDLNNLSEKELHDIFYRISYDNNLKDLRFLIDRIRLRHAVLTAKQSADANIYGKIATKLEYMSNKLQEYGKDQLLSYCGKDFEKMSIEQRKAALYYIGTVSKRIGYESLEIMDKDLLRASSVYKNFNLRDYLKIIKDNPNLYFV